MYRTLATLVVMISTSVLADEYPKVVRRDGQVCVQEKSAEGTVTESCRAERAPLPAESRDAAESKPSENPWLVADQRKASLLLGEDTHGASRGATELLAGQIGALVPGLIASLAGGSSVGGLLLASLASFGLSSLASGVAHVAIGGQAGVGWAFVGNLVGQAAALVINLLALASGGVGLLVAALLIGSALPALGATIALELRDTAVRAEAVATRSAPAQRGAVLASF